MRYFIVHSKGMNVNGSNPTIPADLGLPYLFIEVIEVIEVIEGGHGAGASAEERARTTALGDVYFTGELMETGAR